ncbi:molybdate ABC transporter substrate-binding protein [Crocosphaera sp. Alani8]|uniref:molybdate ABC transporter substrate-binding protein n=1 Tax=Crocosphaera sp. Alani8 TaxID=3038952 RepID=UPI00406BFFBD
MNRKQFLALILTTAITACSPSTSNQEDEKVTLTISAATSVQDAMKAVQPIYQQNNPDVEIVYNFGSSGSLQQQIEQGAPTDVFISAAPKQMNALENKDLLLTETRKNLFKNNVVLITPQDSQTPVKFDTLATADLDRIALGDPKSVPAGQYAKEVLESLESYEELTPKLIYGKDVRQVLFYVETGNVDAGIVYQTDAQISDKIIIADTAPKDYHSPIVYPVAVVAESKNHEEAQKFINFLLAEESQAVFKKYGFTEPEG